MWILASFRRELKASVENNNIQVQWTYIDWITSQYIWKHKDSEGGHIAAVQCYYGIQTTGLTVNEEEKEESGSSALPDVVGLTTS